MVWTTVVLVVAVVLLAVAAVTDPEHRGAFVALGIVWGALALGAALLTRAAARALGRRRE
jgi:hypothetical protein